jgi:hypothetical protein
MPDNRTTPARLRSGARRALSLYASDTAYRVALRLAVLLCVALFMLSFIFR